MTVAELASLALGYVGLPRIFSLDEPTESAKDAKLRYPLAARTVLREGEWACARKFASLVENTVTENKSGRSYLFTLPTDYLRLVALNTEETDYEIAGGLLACDDETADIEYIADISTASPLTYPDDLAVAIALELAVMLALAKKPEASVQLRLEAKEALRRARGSAGLERADNAPELTPWTDA